MKIYDLGVYLLFLLLIIGNLALYSFFLFVLHQTSSFNVGIIIFSFMIIMGMNFLITMIGAIETGMDLRGKRK